MRVGRRLAWGSMSNGNRTKNEPLLLFGAILRFGFELGSAACCRATPSNSIQHRLEQRPFWYHRWTRPEPLVHLARGPSNLALHNGGNAHELWDSHRQCRTDWDHSWARRCPVVSRTERQQNWSDDDNRSGNARACGTNPRRGSTGHHQRQPQPSLVHRICQKQNWIRRYQRELLHRCGNPSTS